MKKKGTALIKAAVFFVLICCVYIILKSVLADHKAPEFNVIDDMIKMDVKTLTENEAALLSGLSAYDDKDGDLTDHILVERITKKENGAENEFIVSYAVFDSASNSTRLERSLILNDYEPPKFVCSKALVFAEDTEINLRNQIIVEDVIDGRVTSGIAYDIPASFVSGDTEPGSYDCSAAFRNSLGDLVSFEFNVEIIGGLQAEREYLPKISLTDYVVYLNAGEEFNPGNYLLSIWDNSAFYRIDHGPLYYLNTAAGKYEAVSDAWIASTGIDIKALATEKVVQQISGNWINEKAVGFSSDIDISVPGSYRGEYTYYSPAADHTASAIIYIFVR